MVSALPMIEIVAPGNTAIFNYQLSIFNYLKGASYGLGA